MITVNYEIAPSRIQGAGKGLFLKVPVRAGQVIVVPSGIPDDCVLSFDRLARQADELQATSVRWFEDTYTVDPDWTDECYLNHSFEPNGLWHLGFVFAARDIDAGEELTVDYRLFITEGVALPFADAQSGQPIVGFPWVESLRHGVEQLAELFARPVPLLVSESS